MLFSELLQWVPRHETSWYLIPILSVWTLIIARGYHRQSKLFCVQEAKQHLASGIILPLATRTPVSSSVWRETDHSLVRLWNWNTSWRAPGFCPALELFGRWDMSMDMLVPSSLPGIHVAADSSLPAVLNTRDYWHRCGLPSSKEEPGLFCLSLNLKKSPFWSCFPLHISPDKGLSSSSPAL